MVLATRHNTSCKANISILKYYSGFQCYFFCYCDHNRCTQNEPKYNSPSNSDVRHSRCVSTTVTELGILIPTVEHNYTCFWYYRRIITTTCFGPICGPYSGCEWTFGSAIQECVEGSWGFLVGGSRFHYNSE